MPVNFSCPKVPPTSGAASKKFLRGPAGPSVEEARAEAVAAQESATTVKNGTRVPKWIANSKSTTRGTGGNTPVAPYTEQEIADADESAANAAQPSVPAVSPFDSGMRKLKLACQRQGIKAIPQKGLTVDLNLVPELTVEEREALLASQRHSSQAAPE